MDRRSIRPIEENTKKKGRMDFVLFTMVMIICVFGLIMAFSASYYYAETKLGDGYYYLKNQALYLGLSVVIMLVVSTIDYHHLEKLRLIALVLTLVLMISVLIWGKDLNGATRWINIAGVSFQPSELAKFCLVLYMASFMARRKPYMQDFQKGILPMCIVLIPIALILLLQKNLSMLIIVGVVWGVMLYIGGAQPKHLLLLMAVALPLVVLFAYIEPYRWARLTIFVDPWKDAADQGHQLIQSLFALGSGGMWGQGLNFSRQKLLYLTYGESDFIFSIIGEELGFIGCVLLITAYFFVIVRGFRVAIRCKDTFGSLLAAGITSTLAIQVAVNIGVVTSSIPPTGQTLPFISTGGTSLLIFLAAMGILLNISRNISTE